VVILEIIGATVVGMFVSGLVMHFQSVNSQSNPQSLSSGENRIGQSRITIIALSLFGLGVASVVGYIAYNNYMTFRYSISYPLAAASLLVSITSLLF
jgi:hypothetical protein